MASRRSGAVRARWVQSAENWAPTFRAASTNRPRRGGTGVGRRIVHGVFHVVSCQQLTHLVAGYERTVQATVGDVVVVELKLFHLGEGDVRATALSASNRRFLAAQSTRSRAHRMHHAPARPERGSTPP